MNPLERDQSDGALPQDLTYRILETFNDPDIQAKVIQSLEKLGQVNVGKNQLRRAIVFLADGDYEYLNELRSSFMGDPRDLLVTANRKLANRDYWFSEPFDQMGELKE